MNKRMKKSYDILVRGEFQYVTIVVSSNREVNRYLVVSKWRATIYVVCMVKIRSFSICVYK